MVEIRSLQILYVNVAPDKPEGTGHILAQEQEKLKGVFQESQLITYSQNRYRCLTAGGSTSGTTTDPKNGVVVKHAR